MQNKANIVIVQGDSWSLGLRLRNSGGAHVNLDGFTPRSQMREGVDSSDALVNVQIEVLEQSDPATKGMMSLSLTPAQTAALPVGILAWDAKLSNADGSVVKTVLFRRVHVRRGVTR